MARTICLLNQKGGVGKTSSCYHLAGTLARMGRRVLLVDNDPQASLTQGFWGPDLTRDVPEVFAAAFPLARDLREPVPARQPISHYKPRSAAAKAARAVADELLERVA